MIRRLKYILPIILILAMLVPIVSPISVFAAPSNKDSYETDAGVGSANPYGVYWYAQTFEATSTYLASSVKIKSYTQGTPPIATVYIHDTHPETGEPTGSAIATGTQNTSGWPTTEGTRDFNEITFTTPVILVDDEVYAIVIKTDGDVSNSVKWQYNNEAIAYEDGASWQSTDSGSTWNYWVGEGANRDLLFQVWGEVDATYPVMTTNAATNVTSSSATLHGTLTDLGSGATNASTYFEWGYLNGEYEFSTTPVVKTSVPASCTANIDLPVGGRVYKYRLVAENDLSKESYGTRVLLTALSPPSTVALDNYVNRQGTITHVFQRKGWYASERSWIIYCKGASSSPDGGFYWKSSADGVVWSDPYFFLEAENGNYWENYPIGGSNEGDELNVYFDGTYLHAVYVWNRNIPLAQEPNTVSNNIWYRRGIPNIDGTISWTSDWVIALARSDDTVKGYASIMTDTNGYPFIDYWESAGIVITEGSNYATPSGAWDRKVIRSTTKDGTFTATTPYTLHSNIGNRGTGTLVQLPEGQLYWIGCGEAQTPSIAGRLYDGDVWETEETIATDAWGRYRFSVVTRGEIIYIVYAVDGGTDINFAKRLDTGWTTPIVIVTDLPTSGEYYYPAPAMTINGATGDLYVFYQNLDTDHILYIKYTVSTDTWETPVDWIDESHNQLAYDDLSTTIGSYLEVYGGKVGVYYLTAYPSWTYSAGADHNIDLRYAYLDIEAGPAVQTNDAASITQTSAILQGYLINDGGETCSVRFQWGLTVTYGTDTAWQSDKETGASFNELLTGLEPNTAYYFRAQAKWADGTTTSGTGKTFITSSAGVPTIVTGDATGVSENTATLQGTLTSLGDYSPVYVLFDYGPTIAYGTLTIEQTETSTGAYSQQITGLSPDTTYHFRAIVRYDGSYVYGSDSTFTTTGIGLSPPTSFSGTRGDTTITLSWSKDAEADNTLVRRSTSGYPTSVSFGTQVYFGTDSSVIDTGLSNSQAYYYSAWSERDGEYSTSYATTYIAPAGIGAGILPPPDSLWIANVKVFESYQTHGDQLITLEYHINYATEPSQNVEDFFALELYDGATLKASVPVVFWGHRPGSIYLSPANALTWEQSFTVKIVGIPSQWEVAPEYSFSAASYNWAYNRESLNELDRWVLTIANHIDSDWIEFTTSGDRLTDEACEIFNRAIPGLSSVRVDICLTGTSYYEYEPIDHDDEYQQTLTRENNLGDYLNGLLDDGGSILGMEGNSFGAMIMSFLCVIVLVVMGARTRSIGWSLVATVPVLLIGNFVGLIPLVATMIVASIIVIYFVFTIWVKGV